MSRVVLLSLRRPRFLLASQRCSITLQFQAGLSSGSQRYPLYQKTDSVKPPSRRELQPVKFPVTGELPSGERLIIDCGRKEELDSYLEYFRAFAAGSDGYGKDEFQDLEYDKQIFTVTKAHILTFKAESSDELQAVGGLNLNVYCRMPNTCDTNLVVLPSARGKGLANFAGMFLTDFAWSQGYNGILSDVLETNPKMMNVASYCGYRCVGHLLTSARHADRPDEFLGSYLYFFDFDITDVAYVHANFTADGLYKPKPRHELSKSGISCNCQS